MPDEVTAAADKPTPTATPSGSEGAAASAGTNGNGAAPDVAALQAELTAAKAAVESERARADKSDGDVASAKRYVVQLVSQLQQAAQPATDADEDKATEAFHERFQRRPAEVLDEVLSTRMAPILHEQFGTLASRERESAKQEAGRRGWDWARYAPAVDAFMEGVPLDARAKPGAYLAAMKLQMVEHFDEELDRRSAKKLEAEKAAALEGPTGQRTTRTPKGLSDMEKRVADDSGMSHEEYLKNKAALGLM